MACKTIICSPLSAIVRTEWVAVENYPTKLSQYGGEKGGGGGESVCLGLQSGIHTTVRLRNICRFGKAFKYL